MAVSVAIGMDQLEGCCVLLVEPLLSLTIGFGRIVRPDVTIARLRLWSLES